MSDKKFLFFDMDGTLIAPKTRKIPQSAIDANLLGKLGQNPGYDGYDPTVEKWNTWEEAVADEQ